MDEELDRFKRVNLSTYAATHGYRLIRREPAGGGSSRGSSAGSLLMRHPTTDDKIVVRLDRDGHWTYFSVRDDRDNGTIIDFLQRRGAPTLAQVRRELRGWCGERRPVEVIAVSAPPRDLAVIKKTFDRAAVGTNHA